MNAEFVQETAEIENRLRLLGCLTGWEVVVFELEDEPNDGERRAASGGRE